MHPQGEYEYFSLPWPWTNVSGVAQVTLNMDGQTGACELEWLWELLNTVCETVAGKDGAAVRGALHV